jgi:hypothetical protein
MCVLSFSIIGDEHGSMLPTKNVISAHSYHTNNPLDKLLHPLRCPHAVSSHFNENYSNIAMIHPPAHFPIVMGMGNPGVILR